jgi:23S rRNA-/tRNA-specific pseudouridylate synthase
VAAKTLIALQTLSRAFQDRKVKKRYRAVVIGKLSSPPHTSSQVITNNDHGDADECAGSTATTTTTTTANNPLKEEEENQQPLCHPSSSCCRSGDGGDSGGTIDCALGGLSAVTRWKVVGDPVPSLKFGWLTTLDLFPSTGRKHQLRRHCAQVLGCPILGDTRYGGNGGGSGCVSDTFLQAEATGNGDNDGDADDDADDDDPDACKQQQQQQIVGELGHEMPSLLKHYSSTSARTSARTSAWSGSGLFLAAVELSLEHPTTGELLSFEIPEPAKFQARRRRERALHDRNRKDEVADSRL